MNNTTASDFRAAPHQPFGAGGILSAVGSNYNSDFGVVDGFDQQSVLNFTRIQREEEFKIQSEDFPALGATLKANGNKLYFIYETICIFMEINFNDVVSLL